MVMPRYFFPFPCRSLIACGQLGDSSTPRVLVGPCTDSLVQRLSESGLRFLTDAVSLGIGMERERAGDSDSDIVARFPTHGYLRVHPSACSRPPVELTALLCIGAFADQRTGVEINSPETIHIRAPHLAIERALVH
jgi:hypothetical protein